jgi:DUF2934 family protein
MSDERYEQRVREEAFVLWNADGRPEGKADEYWMRAKEIIEHQDRLLEQEVKRGEV